MIVWLDQKIFRSGFGLRSPYFDDRYYWLVDTRDRDRKGRNGELYTFSAGFGAQLSSFQWRHPKPGERRRLIGRDFVVFNSSRSWFRVHVSWAMTGMPRDIDSANTAIRAIEADLNSTLMDPRHD